MDVLSKYHALMMLLNTVGGVSGRKKLQKMVYLLQEAGCPFKERFDYHLYGPYSEELAIKLDEMKFLGLLEEKVDITPSGYKQYIYLLSELGKQYLRKYEDASIVPHHFEKLAYELNCYAPRTLELIATLRFLRNMGYSDSEVAEVVKALKPEQEYKDKEITDALNFLDNFQVLAA